MKDSRLTVTETVYFQQPDRPAVVVRSAFEIHSATDEFSYRNILKLKDGVWRAVEVGWVESPGTVVISNGEPSVVPVSWPPRGGKAPGPDVEVSTTPADQEPRADWVIPARTSMRGRPAASGSLRVRAVGGDCYCVVNIFPGG